MCDPRPGLANPARRSIRVPAPARLLPRQPPGTNATWRMVVRRFRLLLLTLLSVLPLAACGDDDGDPDVPATTGGDPTSEQVDRGAYALLRGQDTLAVERFTRTGDRIEGELSSPTENSSVRYDVQLGPQGRVQHAEFDVNAGSGSAPIQASLDVRGDSVFIDEGADTLNARNEARALPPNGTIYLAPSVALLEPVVQMAEARRGGAGGAAGVTGGRAVRDTAGAVGAAPGPATTQPAQAGETVTVPVLVLSLDQNPRMVDARVTFHQDSVIVETAPDNRVVLRTSADGRVTGGSNEPQNLQVTRLNP